MMLLAWPQPGPRPLGPAPETSGAAEAACNWSNEPSDRPSRLDPPTRRMSRRVIPRCGSHRSLPGRPGTMIIAELLSAGGLDGCSARGGNVLAFVVISG